MELWEYNAYMQGYELRCRNTMMNMILTGYYAAYYSNGGKKAKSPQSLMALIYPEEKNIDAGLREIERIKKLEQLGARDGSKN